MAAALIALCTLTLLPVTAQAQGETDTTLVQLGAGTSATRAFVAWPSSQRPCPAVLLVPDERGLTLRARRIARTFSRQGYVSIVPDRPAAGDAGAALDLALAWLRSQDQTREARIAVIGVGSGGLLAQNMAMRSDDLAALVMLESAPRVDANGLAALGAPLMAHFAGEDETVDVALAEQLRTALGAAGKPGKVYVYPGAHHGFMNEARDQYHPDAARLAWARTLSFLQRELKGGE